MLLIRGIGAWVPVMMPKIVSKSHSPYVLETTSAQHRKKKTLKEYRCGTGQIPSEGQLRIFTTLECQS